ncbi:MAG: type II toxin-antitoxin system Phd/YefM family antitoxin [Leptolyngbya sp. IPPAS B-1204]|nr:type II toxin-antitoxin system Phd/YefM family antitoxin [Elainella sp. C42_A2020_010]RNJ69732.1 MAG: type II toxin-antitoxin system Phd/YefM family antitoxin [Leptolyngbya sp. IPPAS B-1204]
MNAIPIAQAMAKLYRLVEEATTTHKPILIQGEHSNAVLVSEEDWRAIQETLHLLSVPGMRESIQAGIQTPIEECDEEITW